MVGWMWAVWLIGGLLWCSEDWSGLRLAICPRGETVSPAQWWAVSGAEWNLVSGQVCPARGYPSQHRPGRALQRMMKLRAVYSAQCLLHKPAWMCIFCWEMSSSWNILVSTTCKLAAWLGIHRASNEWSLQGLLTSHQSDSSGMWPCPSAPACTGTTHLTQSNILASQTSALLGGRAGSVSDEVTISYTYLVI